MKIFEKGVSPHLGEHKGGDQESLLGGCALEPHKQGSGYASGKELLNGVLQIV